MSDKASKEVSGILKGLASSKTDKVIESIEKSRKDGDLKTLKAIIQTLKDTDEPDVEASIIAFLYDLKNEDCIPLLIEALYDEALKYYQNYLVAVFWQSALDGSAYLKDFVEVAVNGEYMTAVEALTVIENFDTAFDESELLECEAILSEAIEVEKDENKLALLTSMADVVRNLPLIGE